MRSSSRFAAGQASQGQVTKDEPSFMVTLEADIWELCCSRMGIAFIVCGQLASRRSGKGGNIMQLEYDLTIGALYIQLSDARVVRTREIDGNTNVDLAEDGTVVGIEVLDIDLPWPLADIIRDYEIPAGEIAQLRSYFPMASPMIKMAEPAPAMLPEAASF
jgi:uncharacterized protein YuzE